MKKMNYYCVGLIGCLLAVASCREKTKLEGEFEPFAGEWLWDYSHLGDQSYVHPILEESELRLHLTVNGRFEIFEGGQRQSKGRILLEQLEDEKYWIELLDGNRTKVASYIKLQHDTLVLSAWPYAANGNYFLPIE